MKAKQTSVNKNFIKITRYNDCPAGKRLQPCSPRCKRCCYHVSTEFNTCGMYGEYVTKCSYYK